MKSMTESSVAVIGTGQHVLARRALPVLLTLAVSDRPGWAFYAQNAA